MKKFFFFFFLFYCHNDHINYKVYLNTIGCLRKCLVKSPERRYYLYSDINRVKLIRGKHFKHLYVSNAHKHTHKHKYI